MQRIFIKKYFLFKVGSVCRVKQFTAGWQTFRWRRGWNGGGKWLRQQSKDFYAAGFDAMGDAYQCWWRICREINVFFKFPISHVLLFISIYDLFTDSPSYLVLTEQLAVTVKPDSDGSLFKLNLAWNEKGYLSHSWFSHNYVHYIVFQLLLQEYSTEISNFTSCLA
jgi:hypothetical protein